MFPVMNDNYVIHLVKEIVMDNQFPTSCPHCGSDLHVTAIVMGHVLLVCLAHGIVWQAKQTLTSMYVAAVKFVK